jgi:elongation factor P
MAQLAEVALNFLHWITKRSFFEEKRVLKRDKNSWDGEVRWTCRCLGLARDWKMMSGPRSLEEVFGSRTRILPRKGSYADAPRTLATCGGVESILEGQTGREGQKRLLPEDIEEFMAALIEAINVKRKTLFEFEGAPYVCLDSDISTPTARGGQTLVRLKMRNLLTRAVFDKTFKAQDKFGEPDLEYVDASYLYTDGDGSHFLDQQSFETHTLTEEKMGDGLNYLVEGAMLQLHMYNGAPIGLQLPIFVELDVKYTEPGVRGDTSSGSVTKAATMETGFVIKVPLFIKEGEKVRVSTETGEFTGRA